MSNNSSFLSEAFLTESKPLEYLSDLLNALKMISLYFEIPKVLRGENSPHHVPKGLRSLQSPTD